MNFKLREKDYLKKNILSSRYQPFDEVTLFIANMFFIPKKNIMELNTRTVF